MASLRVISSELVKPAEQTPREVMYLSECDQIKPLTHTPAVRFYPASTARKPLPDLIRMVKDSLSKALIKFYPLAGRLHWSDRISGRVELHCNAMGALLVEAESDLEMDDFGDLRPEEKIRSLYPAVDPNPVEEIPMLLVQITRLRCGGVAVATGFCHVVADGLSATHFVAEWAKIARGEEYSDDPPFLDRTVLRVADHHHPECQHSYNKYKYSDFFPLPQIIGRSDNLGERRKETVALMVKLSKNHIQSLMKNKAGGFSRYDVVSAHVWKCLSIARGLRPEQETVTVDFRNRITPPLPKRYFGNAVMPVPVRSTVGELLSEQVNGVARKIKAAVNGVSDEYVRSYLSCVRGLTDVASKRHFHTVGSQQGLFYGNPNLIVTSWQRLPFKEANVLGEKDRVMVPGSLGYDGRVILMSDPD